MSDYTSDVRLAAKAVREVATKLSADPDDAVLGSVVIALRELAGAVDELADEADDIRHNLLLKDEDHG
jgi:hypothetical protein